MKLKRAQTVDVDAKNIHPAFDGAKLENNDEGAGIKVAEVKERSNAAYIGLKKGDVIVGINRKPIENIAELRSVLKDKKGVFALNIKRGDSNLYIMIR